MEKLTPIKGKDAPLERTLEVIKEALGKAGFEIIEKECANPLSELFWVFIQDKNHPSFFSNGKGYSKKAALASAYAEFAERAFSGFFFQELYLGDEEGIYLAKDEVLARSIAEVLNPKWRRFYSMEGSLGSRGWIDFQTPHQDHILSLPFKRLGGEESLLFPQALLHNLYASNGIAAGNTLQEALVQAISEVIERAVRFEVIAKGYALPDIPMEVLAQHKEACSVVEALQGLGYEVRLKDASLGRSWPVVAALLINPKDAGAMLLFGAHPNFEVALLRTLSELLQGRDPHRGFKGLEIPVLEVEECADSRNLESHFINSTGKIPWRILEEKSDFAFESWGVEGDREAELEYLARLLERFGLEVFYKDHSRLGFFVVRVVIPSFSEVYPLEDMKEANMNEGKFFRARVLAWESLEGEALGALLDDLEEVEDHRGIEEFLGIELQERSYLKGAMIGEFKILVALYLGERGYALEGVRWVLEGVDRSHRRFVDYALLERVLSSKAPLKAKGIFPEDSIKRVEGWLKGEREPLFIDLAKAGLARRIATL